MRRCLTWISVALLACGLFPLSARCQTATQGEQSVIASGQQTTLRPELQPPALDSAPCECQRCQPQQQICHKVWTTEWKQVPVTAFRKAYRRDPYTGAWIEYCERYTKYQWQQVQVEKQICHKPPVPTYPPPQKTGQWITVLDAATGQLVRLYVEQPLTVCDVSAITGAQLAP